MTGEFVASLVQDTQDPNDIGSAARLRWQDRHSDGSMPADLLREQSTRIQLIYVVGAVLWTINLLMDHVWAPQGDRGPYRSLIEVGGVALAAATAAFARFSSTRDDTKVTVGVALMVPHALGLALLNSWAPQPATVRPLSSITVLILLFGMLAPSRPTTMFVTALSAASMDPLAVWIAHLRGLPVPSPITTFLLFYPNYVCALLAVVPARLIHRFGRQISEARALGSYELVELLGEGGMGEVWLARHRLLARGAAIKLIRQDVFTNGKHDLALATLRRFEREARATASLTSPHTVRIFDFGLTREGRFYYVMELLDGYDLESLVHKFGPLPPARAVYLVRQVCRSLSEAHGMGLIHRDIKPANIYACRMGVEYDFVKVLDFGLVRYEYSADSGTASAESIAMGTPAYMAPETILGKEPDRRVDIYAIGCLLRFLLTGEPVFRSRNGMGFLMQHLHVTPAPPSRHAEHPISKSLDDLVLDCLQKDPALRPATVEEVLQRAMTATESDSWDEQAARRWWEVHLPDRCVSGPTPTATSRALTGSAWLVPSWRD
jgi:tRNA A-37 threonylcarbamoyl transferase component Bud32